MPTLGGEVAETAGISRTRTIWLMNDKENKAFDALPKPEQGLDFRLGRVTTMYDPHPGPERHGAKCPTKGCNLKYADHKSQLLAVIVLDTKDAMRCDLD